QHLRYGLVAAVAAEDEEDRGQEVLGPEKVDDLGPVEASLFELAAMEAIAVATAGASALGGTPASPAATDRGELQEFGVDTVGGGLARRIEQVAELAAHEDVLIARHGPLLRDDDGGIAAHGREPVSELLGVGDGRAE